MSKFLTIISKVAAFLLSTVFLFILLALVALLLFEGFASKNNISTMIKNVDLKEVEVKVNNQKETAFNYIYGYTSQLGLSEQETLDLLKKDEVNDIVAKYLENIADFYLYGEDIHTYTKEEIALDITKINKLLPVEKQINLNDKELKETVTEVNNLSNDLTKEQMQVESKTSFISFDKSYIKNIEIYMLITLVVIFFLIALVRLKLYSSLGWCGIPLASVGCFYMLFSLTRFSINLLKDKLSQYEYVINMVTKNIFNKSFIYGLVIFIIGLIMIITYNVIKNKKNYQEAEFDDKNLDNKNVKS